MKKLLKKISKSPLGIFLSAVLLLTACGEEEKAVVPDDPFYPLPGVVTKEIAIPSKGIVFNMVLVRAGQFKMGDPKLAGESHPNPLVFINNDYYISTTEVTQKMWKAVMGDRSNPSNFLHGDDLPVEGVTYEQAIMFCERITQLYTQETFSLPTEAQWEYAARGGHMAPSPITAYAGSNVIDRVAWSASNSEGVTHKVKEKAPNPLGLYDMSGNVCEWCLDGYAPYPADTLYNPCSENGTARCIRGGAWNSTAQNCCITERDYANPEKKLPYVGLRLVININNK